MSRLASGLRTPDSRLRPVAVAAVVAGTVVLAAQTRIEERFFDGVDHPAIAYATTPADDPVQRLDRDLGSGVRRLTRDPATGYLRSLLQLLDVPESSQVTVFSKTSLQARLIDPATPRAIYFNDTTMVAWPAGGFVEIAAQDPRQGVQFYALDQRDSELPRLIAHPPPCLNCHLSYATSNVPGTLVRSVATGPRGQPLPHLYNGTTTHRTPLAQRWAGWFVTGQTGRSAHLGNAVTPSEAIDLPSARPSALEALPDTAGPHRYPSAHSDIAALLVFDHQTHLMNLLTRLGWEVRVAMADRPSDVRAVAERAAVDVVDYLLFVDEAPLAGPVGGTSGFAAAFEARGPRDGRGRSLRDLDLETRIFRYRCSYMIYAPAFDALPEAARGAVYARLWQVLSGMDRAPRYARLPLAERQAIVEILRDTKPGLPETFTQAVAR
jgi:hypothetical protein